MPRVSTANNQEANLAFGKHLRTERLIRSWTIGTLAEKAGVSKDTIVRIERGEPSTSTSRSKVCDALLVHEIRLELTPPIEEQDIAIHRDTDARYRTLVTHRTYSEPADESERIQNEAERARLGGLGHVARFVKMYNCRLPDGHLVAGELEIYGPGLVNKIPPGEILFIVHVGRIKISFSERAFELGPGDAATVSGGKEQFTIDLVDDGPESFARLTYVRVSI